MAPSPIIQDHVLDDPPLQAPTQTSSYVRLELRSTRAPSSQRPRLTLTSVVTVNESNDFFFLRPVTPHDASSGEEWYDHTLNGDYAPAEEEEDLIHEIGDFRDAEEEEKEEEEESLVHELADTSIQYLPGINSYCDPYWSDSPSTIANQDYGSEEEKEKSPQQQIAVPSDDLFSQPPDVQASMYDGPIVPTEFYKASPPYYPWALRGRTPIRLICQSLNIPVYTPVQAIADFLARNVSIIRHLVFQTVAHPDWFFEHALAAYEVRVTGEARERCRNLLRAIGEVSWQDARIEDALQMATERTDGDLRRLSMMRKVRQKNKSSAVRGALRVRYSEFARRPVRSHSLLRHVINADDLE